MDNDELRAGSVLVGTDGSASAELAVEWAAGEAARRETGLHVLYAFPWLTRARAWEFEPPAAITENGERVVGQAKDRVAAGHPGVTVTSEVRIEDPALALVKTSQAASVVVVGAQGLGGTAETILGSVAQKVAAHAATAVVVVRRDAEIESDRPVIVGMDPVDGAPEALEYAFEEATRRGQRLVVIQGSQDDAAFRDFPDAVISGLYDSTASEQAMHTSERLNAWHKQFPEVPFELRLVHERPVKALVQASPESSIVVVGSRGRSGLVSFLLGSVSRGVLSRAPVVAVVRTREERNHEAVAQQMAAEQGTSAQASGDGAEPAGPAVGGLEH